jgi:NADH:ubiquinone oxidoreductase subunit K
MNITPVVIAAVGVIGLLGVGLFGLLTAGNLIRIIIALQILGKAAALAMLTAGYLNNQIQLGQSLALTVIVADTIVAAIGLALAVQVQKQCGTLDLRALATLRR